MRQFLNPIAAKIKSLNWLNNALRYHPVYYPQAQQFIEHATKTDAKQRRALDKIMTEQALKHAHNIPAGKQHINASSLKDWPILEKKHIRSSAKQFMGQSLVSIPAATGGSSGVPLKLMRSLKNLAYEQAFLDHLISPYNFRTNRIAVLRGDNVKDPSDMKPPFGKYRDKNHLILSSPHLGPNNVTWFIEELRRFQPEVLWIYPTSGNFLAWMLLETEQTLPIPIIFSSSEMMFPETWVRLKQAFGGKIIDYYGQAERVCLAYQTKLGESWFMPGYGHVELHPLEQNSSQPSMREATIIATSFWNSKMPLIRYATGDRILYPASYTEEDLEDVALGLKPFTSMVGRESEFLLTPNGERVVALNNIPREVDHLLRLQIIQHNLTTVELRLRPTLDFNKQDEEKLLKNARLKIPQDMAITIVSNKELVKSTAGKTPFVIRCL